MKSGKKIILNSNNNKFKIISGAIENYKAPNSVWVNITSWVTTKKDVKNLDSLKKEFRNEIKNYLKNDTIVRNYFKFDSILQVEISPTGIKLNKPTFFTLELNLYQKNNLPLVKPKNSKKEDLKPILEKISNDILNFDLFNNNKFLNYQLTKK